MSYNNANIDRMLLNLIRYGRIKSVEGDTATVDFDGEVVPGIPWGKARAGNTSQWYAPSVGEQCCVTSPSGDLAQGSISHFIEQDDFPNPGDSPDKDITKYPDGTIVEYDSSSNTLTIDTSAASGTVIIKCNTATVEAAASVTIDSPETTCTGNLTVAKSLSVGTAGGTSTMKGNMTIEGGIKATQIIESAIDVKGGGKSLIGHTNDGKPVD